jgi:hypothetical protein
MGSPANGYNSYSFGLNGWEGLFPRGEAYIDYWGGGEIYEAYEISEEQAVAISRELKYLSKPGIAYARPYGLYTCRDFSEQEKDRFVERYNLKKTANHPRFSSPNAHSTSISILRSKK